MASQKQHLFLKKKSNCLKSVIQSYVCCLAFFCFVLRSTFFCIRQFSSKTFVDLTKLCFFQLFLFIFFLLSTTAKNFLWKWKDCALVFICCIDEFYKMEEFKQSHRRGVTGPYFWTSVDFLYSYIFPFLRFIFFLSSVQVHV